MLSKDKTDKLIEIFVSVDDFCLHLDGWLKSNPQQDYKKPRFEGRMTASEVMAITIFYQFSGYKCFQYYYHDMVQQELTSYFGCNCDLSMTSGLFGQVFHDGIPSARQYGTA